MDKTSRLQNAGPLRLGGTSCTVDAGLADNVRLLGPHADDIELIFYEYEGQNNFLDKRSLQTLLKLKDEYALTYTVHLPSRLGAGPLDEDWQKGYLRLWESCILNTYPLNPFAYIWHWDAEQYGPCPAADLQRWRSRLLNSADALLSKDLTDPAKLCVENLGFDFSLIFPSVLERGLSVCLDIGHWWNNWPASDQRWRNYAERAKVFHLHGVNLSEHKDHIGLQRENLPLLKSFAEHLRKLSADGQERVLTFEVFSPQDLRDSMAIWRQINEMTE
ncbi:sugar phosphate isomerase/epimerase [bacterium]|nr:sugar phosphate isomerase/epimerase [bacterium]